MSRPATAGGAPAQLRDVGVDPVGDVGAGAAGRQVAVPAQADLPAGGRHRAWQQPVGGQVGQHGVVDRDLGERAGVALAAPRVGVQVVNELHDRGIAIPGQARRPELGRRADHAVDHEHPVILAGHVALDDHLAGPRSGRRAPVGLLGFGRGADLHGDAPAMVAVPWLDHDGRADLAERPDRLGLVCARPCPRAPGCRPWPGTAWRASCRRRCPRRWPRSARSWRR